MSADRDQEKRFFFYSALLRTTSRLLCPVWGPPVQKTFWLTGTSSAESQDAQRAGALTLWQEAEGVGLVHSAVWNVQTGYKENLFTMRTVTTGTGAQRGRAVYVWKLQGGCQVLFVKVVLFVSSSFVLKRSLLLCTYAIFLLCSTWHNEVLTNSRASGYYMLRHVLKHIKLVLLSSKPCFRCVYPVAWRSS